MSDPTGAKAMATPGAAYIESLKSGTVLNVQYPHCDWRVLHAPHECQYCDMRGHWQQARIDEKICFTSDSRNQELAEMYLRSGKLRNEEGWMACPGYMYRGDQIKVWTGNQAKPAREFGGD